MLIQIIAGNMFVELIHGYLCVHRSETKSAVMGPITPTLLGPPCRSFLLSSSVDPPGVVFAADSKLIAVAGRGRSRSL